MLQHEITLNLAEVERKYWVKSVKTKGILRRRLLDLGLIPGTEIKVLQSSPAGRLKSYMVRGGVIAIRDEDAAKITVQLK